MDIDDHLFTSLFEGIVVSPLTWPVLVAILLAVLLLFVSAYMSGSEVAFFSLSPAHIEEIRASKESRDQDLVALLDDSERLLGTILVGNNMVNVAIVMLANYAIASTFDFSASPALGFLVQVGLLTFLLLLFGEILPKIYCQSRPLRFSRAVAPSLRAVMRLFSPVTYLLVRMSRAVTGSVQRKTFNLSPDELSKAIQLTTQTDEEQELLKGIVQFYNKTASDVMTPRMDIEALEYDTPYREALQFVVDKGYSRIPVYAERIDDIKGILYIKDLLPHLTKDNTFEWQTLLRPVFYVPDSKRVDRLLEDFREQKIHLGIVVDEFGGTSGLVTMEDLLEEIVGEISDEYDEDNQLYHTEPDGAYIFDAKVSLTDFLKIVKMEQPTATIEEKSEEVDTLGGLLLEVKGDFPTVGEEIVIDNCRFLVLEMGRRRISKVRYSELPQQ